MMNQRLYIHILLSACIAVFAMLLPARAADMTSSNFIIRDPIVGTGGGYGSSTSFNLFSSGNMTLSGISASTNFITRDGFLYYPYARSGVLTAVPNGQDADLSWTASSAGGGWNISGYNTGIATISGGPYTYTAVGNVTSHTYENLELGEYCFVIQTLDAFSNVIATSNEECITITPALSFAISDSSVEFGPLSFIGPRYATPSGGSNTNTVAHTMTASGNGQSGYTITYVGPTLSSGGNSIPAATIASDADGTPGTEQFALSLSTDGGAGIESEYEQDSLNWSFIPNTTTTVASTSEPTAPETYSFRYLTNASSGTESGLYSTGITYILTGNF